MRVRLLLALVAVACVVATGAATTEARAAETPPLPTHELMVADRSVFISAAEEGLAQVDQRWWSPDYDFYLSQPGATGAQPLPSLWYVFPLFEAKAAVAIAHPTTENKAALDRFAKLAENYWDPTIAGGSGGYSWYFALRNTGNAYFDDNGWWGIAYLDAYRATKNPRWLQDAVRALTFIDKFGWDKKNGGVWWNVAHDYKTSEPLAAGTLIAAELYRITRKPTYLAIAKKYIAWADANTRNPRQGMLYGRNPGNLTVMDYVEGLMAAAHGELCAATKQQTFCDRAKQIAEASLEQFPILADWAPETDVVFLRSLIDLYEQDGDPRWYAVVYANAKRAYENAQDEEGLWSKRWDGGWTLPGAIYTQSATVELFAWVASVEPPR